MSNSTDTGIEQAKTLLAAGDWEKAKGIYEEILRKEPTMREALADLADIEYCRGRLPDSKRLCLEILRYRPFDDRAIRGLLAVYLTGLRRKLQHVGGGSKWSHALREFSLQMGLLVAYVAETVLENVGSQRYRRLFPRSKEGRFSCRDVFSALQQAGGDIMVKSLHYPRVIETPLALSSLGVRRGARILDIGCGGSIAPAVLAQKGIRATGVDLDAPSVERQRSVFRKRFPEEWAAKNLTLSVADARHLPFAENSFDGVLAISTLEHIPGTGDSEAMGEIARVLSPGGRAFVSLEFAPTFHESWFSTNIGAGYETGGGARWLVRYYDLPSIERRIIEPSGLEVVERGFIGETTSWGAHGLARSPAWDPLPPSFLNPVLALCFIKRFLWEKSESAVWKVPYVVLKKPDSEKICSDEGIQA
jgi:SAM-dependent methyltransferase